MIIPARPQFVLFLGACSLLVVGCVTQIRKPTSAPQPSSVKFGQYDAVTLMHVDIDPKLASSTANQEAVKKIDEHLVTKMHDVFRNLQDPETSQPSARANGRTLIISPYVSDIKFISGVARFFVGAAAGSSAVLMKVTYTDAETHRVIADPEFYEHVNAIGNPGMGWADNLMLELIADDIVHYSKLNH
jgi:hypothetical protein